MQIAGIYSFKDGKNFVKENHPELLKEVLSVISSIDASNFRTKTSKEKTIEGKLLYSPVGLNRAFKSEFQIRNWRYNVRVKCKYPTEFYTKDFTPPPTIRGAFREMDYIKGNLGIEVQLGKYAFMVYNVCAKMTIFKNLGMIDSGIEIVPIKTLADQMSSGVSYFEQIVWDLEKRGVADIDIPVIIIGIGVS